MPMPRVRVLLAAFSVSALVLSAISAAAEETGLTKPPEVTRHAPSLGATLPALPGASAAGSGTTSAPGKPTPAATPPAEPAPAAAAPAATAPTPAATPTPDAPATTAAAVAPPTEPEAKPAALRVATWGGAYGEAQQTALFAPYASATGIRVETVGDGQGLTAIGAADLPGWDVANVPANVAEEACGKGLIRPVDPARLPSGADGTPAAVDFFSGFLTRCGVASLAWSAVWVVPAQSKNKVPTTLKEIFEPRGFKGKRALPRSPRYLLETALLSDGVATAEVYPLLSTPEGVERAFGRLNTIRNQIVWWKDPAEPLQWLKEGKVAMALAFSGRAFHEIAAGSKPLRLIWDGQILDVDMWVVSKDSRHPDAAAGFVAEASRPERLAEVARWFPYGPPRRSAVAMVGSHASLGIDLAPFLPTAPANLGSVLRFDGRFWAEHEAELTRRLEEWISPSAGGTTGSGAKSESKTSG